MAQASTLIGKAVRSLRNLAARLLSDRGGNVVMIFALVMPALIMITLGGIDINRITTVKARVQDALDAAALAAARSSHTDPVKLREVAVVALRANLRNASVEPFADSDVKIQLTDNQVIIADLKVQVKTLVANVFLPPYGTILDKTLPVNVHSEVNRSSRNIEVALALDITGSMDNCTRNCPPTSKIAALRAAANELVGIVVQDEQSPYYSKIALVPYSMGVNVGAYADTVRGTLRSTSRSISATTWLTGSVKTISDISRASTAVVSSSGHGFVTGDKVVIWGAEPMASLNGSPLSVVRVDANKFQLSGINSRNFNSFAGSAYVAKCARTDCSIVITAAQHGLSTAGDAAYLTDMGGLAQLNGIGFAVSAVANNTATLSLNGSSARLAVATKGGASYTSGGQLACGIDGCTVRDFINQTGTWIRQNASTCVSERTGSAWDTDARPAGSSTYVGRNYPGAGNTCPSVAIVPLTNVKKTITGEINKLAASGSTAGHIGLAWAWYMVSPNFGVWSGTAAPAQHDTTKTLKAIVLMTDGEFNTPYFGGVIAADAGTGSGGVDTHINQPAANGSSFYQSFELCKKIRDSGVIIYTVGFDIPDAANLVGEIDSAGELMQRCASGSARAFQAGNSTDLSKAFRDIGRDITRLRISR
ncbi:TadE/TadG family type IV pilus assembly protein [Brevundimonas sp. G8]|uniref:TadE/TadG family type IV pilus assembly protein n=1 Tax=Brevundimonas sp. G8 TaxID=1350776 RepID=UPI001F304828|nr:TadE/TadG family type IV pilus assembly protein [Brevundimonas sp. G8]